jgi:Domain of unknown function (DUF1707)
VAAGNEMRVSDAERDAAATELREHFASGRLNQDELDQRLTAVFAAKTRGELNALFTDLPSGPGGSGAGTSGGQPPGGGPFGAFGAGGPFGPSGPFGPGGARPGAWGGPWARPGVTDDEDGWGARGGSWRGGGRRSRGPGRMLSRVIVSSVLLWALLIVGILGVFGIGTGRPIGIVLIVAAFALLRRLLFIIFGRRRVGRGGGRGRGGRGRGRRWS